MTKSQEKFIDWLAEHLQAVYEPDNLIWISEYDSVNSSWGYMITSVVSTLLVKDYDRWKSSDTFIKLINMILRKEYIWIKKSRNHEHAIRVLIHHKFEVL